VQDFGHFSLPPSPAAHVHVHTHTSHTHTHTHTRTHTRLWYLPDIVRSDLGGGESLLPLLNHLLLAAFTISHICVSPSP
jgi:hypothetical protein